MIHRLFNDENSLYVLSLIVLLKAQSAVDVFNLK